ncbi:DUF2953 domain-containing protein [Neobacillus niacini]|uniref:DUF2953 domain-containing protein n=1 Tax=Neobacillus niacini TaxID=86668 RepID=UPI00286CFD4E|nr:DUF2953 domain-containing protein [Neobacillus niacini]
MIWFLLIFVILLLLFLLIIFTKLTIKVNYYHHNDNDDLKIEFRIWFGLIKFKKHIPLIKIDDNSPSIVVKSKKKKDQTSDKSSNDEVHQITPKDMITNLKNTKEILQHVIHMHVIIRKFFKKISIKQFEWHTMFGVGDAAHTGVLCGGLWTIKGGIVGLLSNYFKLKEMPILTVTPHFQAIVIQTQVSCMFEFRIGQAILAGLKLIKFWKGGSPKSKSNTNFSKEKTKSV